MAGKQRASWWLFFIFLKLGFTPCKVEYPLQSIELQEKEVEKDENHIGKHIYSAFSLFIVKNCCSGKVSFIDCP